MPRGRRPRRRFTAADIRAIAEAHGTICVRCGRPIDLEADRRTSAGPTVDHHPIPWTDGGTDALENLRLAHSACNKSAGARPILELGPRSRAW